MKRFLLSFALMLGMICFCGKLQAQIVENDSIDVLHNEIVLDFDHLYPGLLYVHSQVTFIDKTHASYYPFDVIVDSLISIDFDGQNISPYTFAFGYDASAHTFKIVPNPENQIGDTHVLTMTYCVVPSSFGNETGDGGIFFRPEENLFYNLGESRTTPYSHSVGRAWHPCRDNFYEKSTYHITFTSRPGWHQLCSGTWDSEVVNPDSSTTSQFTLDKPVSSYAVGIWAGADSIYTTSFQGVNGTIPAVFTVPELASVSQVADFVQRLQPIINTFESHFGPFPWNRIGYVNCGNSYAGMEHVDNIAVPMWAFFIEDPSSEYLLYHELAHFWFGDLVTGANEREMWFNEGGATFAEELALEALHGSASADSLYQSYIEYCLRGFADDGCPNVPLLSTPHRYSFDGLVYRRGGIFWHSLRGYMGDSLFYSSMRRLFSTMAYSAITSQQLIDSLSLYSGIPIGEFVNFNLATTGFLSYSLEQFVPQSNGATITVLQRLRDTDVHLMANRLPVTFFSADLQQADCLMVFDDTLSTQTFSLPFTPAFAILDYHHQLSDACTENELSLADKATTVLPQAYAKVVVSQPTSNAYAWAHVGHHSLPPAGDMPDGVLRVANRFWQVSGLIPNDVRVRGQFGYNNSSIDRDFLIGQHVMDSVGLIYRADPSQEWQLVSVSRTSSSTICKGFFVAKLAPGQYALAVVDTNIISVLEEEPLSITQVGQDAGALHLILAPNPSTQGQFKVMVADCDKKFDLQVFDLLGRKMLQQSDVVNGQVINHQLPVGRYIVIIKNNFLSLHSQIIIQ